MADVNPSTEIQVTPNLGMKSVYVKADKVSQNDTVTLGNYSTVLVANGFIEPDSGNWVQESVERVDGTANQVKLTGSTTGTVHLWLIVEE